MALQNKIILKQPKYILPAILYFPLLGLGYLIIDIFDTEIVSKNNSELQTTTYLNSDLPSANVREGLGGKRENVQKTFGDIRDLSAIETIENDLDSVNKKEDFNSNYTEKEISALLQSAKEKEKRERYQEMQNKLSNKAKDVRDLSGTDFVRDISDEEREKLDEMRRNNTLDDLEKALVNIRGEGASLAAGGLQQATKDVERLDSINESKVSVNTSVTIKKNEPVKALEEDDETTAVVKKVREENSYFNTVSVNESESNMIKAIIDEDIKAVDGSRVRLRLLDDIEVNEVVLKKGSYLYCIMSGFGSQRVKGKVQSVLIDDHLEKVSLSLYDLDGLEGLYIPASSFREATKDIGSQALQNNMDVTDGMSTNTNVLSWASNALQNSYQRVSNAISKNIRKNKVKIKYGTQVYLINSSQKKGGSKSRAKEARGSEAEGSSLKSPSIIRNFRTFGLSSRPSLTDYGRAVGE